jgi:hypothetical protein
MKKRYLILVFEVERVKKLGNYGTIAGNEIAHYASA